MGMDYSKIFDMLRGNGEAGTSIGSKFLYALFSKWYYMVAAAALVVTYNVFRALDKAGILAKIESHVSSALDSVIKISEECPARLIDFQDFLTCIGL